MNISRKKSIFSDARLSQQMLSDGVRPLLTPLEQIVLILRANTNRLREDVLPLGPIVLILRTNETPLKEDVPPL